MKSTLKSDSRGELRKQAVNKFLSEKSGYWKDGKKHVSRYKYYVESTKEGKRIYLFRPTFLNKGIDFQLWVEKFDGREDRRPSHKDVFHDIKTKKKENPNDMLKLLKVIDEVWSCREPDEVLKNINFNYKSGFSIELLLKILKWLFIEQDVTYWNYDGRGMLRMAIDKEAGNFEFTKKFTDSNDSQKNFVNLYNFL